MKGHKNSKQQSPKANDMVRHNFCRLLLKRHVHGSRVLFQKYAFNSERRIETNFLWLIELEHSG